MLESLGDRRATFLRAEGSGRLSIMAGRIAAILELALIPVGRKCRSRALGIEVISDSFSKIEIKSSKPRHATHYVVAESDF